MVVEVRQSGSGMMKRQSFLLQANLLLREVFGLGAPVPDGLPTTKLSKNDRVSTSYRELILVIYNCITISL